MRGCTRIGRAGLVVVACTLALTGCGGTTDSDRVVDVVKRGLVTTNPADCTRLMTHAYLLQNHLGNDATVLSLCMQDLRDPTGNAKSVDVSNVEVKGAQATVSAAIHGGDLDGQTLRVGLRRQGTLWRLDRIVAFLTFRRAKFLHGVATDFSSGPGALSKPLAACIVGGLTRVTDTGLEAVVLSDDHTPLLLLVARCDTLTRTPPAAA